MGKTLLKLLAGPLIAASALLGGCSSTSPRVINPQDPATAAQMARDPAIQYWNYVRKEARKIYSKEDSEQVSNIYLASSSPPYNEAYQKVIQNYEEHAEEIIRTLGGIDNIHKVLPWTKRGLKDQDKVALFRVYNEIVNKEEIEKIRRQNWKLISLFSK